jgi:hypothetical protein
MTPTETRTLFAGHLAWLKLINQERVYLEGQLHERWNAARIAALEALPRAKGQRAPKLLPDEIHNALIEPYQNEGEWLGVAAEAEKYRIECELRELAPTTPIHPGEPRLYHTCYASSYGSQGWGAFSYAKGRAELDADDARACGLPVEVRPIVEKRPSTISPGKMRVSERVEVWVSVAEDLDLEIIRRRPRLTLREQVRLCWKRGVNPRVYNPYLPHGYEEREGIDMQGNDLRAKSVP